MRRLINVVQSGRFDPTILVTHRFSLEDIKQGYEIFGDRSEGVLKVLITP
jgi:threonine dehydrogenase-like Zn-dependent dehydrogenase